MALTTAAISRINWRNGAISQFVNENEFITTFTDGSKEWRKHVLSPITLNYNWDLNPNIGVLHRMEFALDDTDTNVLQPAKIGADGIVEYWVDGKKVTEDWYPKKPRTPAKTMSKKTA